MTCGGDGGRVLGAAVRALERHTRLMRRPVAAWAAAGALLAVLSACTGQPPDGTDGDLLNGWPEPPAPAPFRPVAGECHETVTPTVRIDDRGPVSCHDLHVAETYH